MSFFQALPSVQWLKTTMLAKNASTNRDPKPSHFFSTADTKFTDTTLGGNLAINPLPQFTRSADIKRRGRSQFGYGMGRVYSERFDDNQQIINMRLGVATFNSLTTFVTGFYSAEMGSMARTGRGTGVMFAIGKAAGFVANVHAWKLMAFQIIGKAFAFFSEKGTSRFYRLKPVMPVYWQTVQTIVNQLAVNIGASPRAITQVPVSDRAMEGYEFTESDLSSLQSRFPGLFTSQGSIDVWAVANRAQRMYRSRMLVAENLYSTYRAGVTDSLEKNIAELYTDPEVVNDPGRRSFQSYFKQWLDSGGGQMQGVETDATTGEVVGAGVEMINSMDSDDPTIKDYFIGELEDGSAFASIRVNYTGSVQETVTNQSGESELAADLNGLSASARNLSFKLAGGNVAPVIGDMVKAGMSAAEGFLDSFGLSGIVNAAIGGAFLDIPHQWKSSMMQMTKSTYVVDLISPYNHPMAKLMYQFIPMAMLMAAAFPRSTGKQSYYAPPLMEIFDKGRAQSRLAMIDSLTFERGVTNLGFNHQDRAMGIRATFTVADMTNIIHVPISMTNDWLSIVAGFAVGGPVLGAVNAVKEVAKQFLDDDTPFNDYMAVIAGLGIADQIHTTRKMKLNMTRAMMSWENWTSPARIAHVVGDYVPSRVLSTLFPVNVKLG